MQLLLCVSLLLRLPTRPTRTVTLFPYPTLFRFRCTFQAMSTDSHVLQALQGANFSFTRRPEPIAGDLRMSWGIGIVLLSLLHSRGKKGSFLKLQFLAHAIRTKESRDQVDAVLRGELRTSDIQVREMGSAHV